MRLLEPGPRGMALFFDSLEEVATGGNLTTDVLIASVAKEHGARLYRNVRDFERFGGIKRVNPLAKS